MISTCVEFLICFDMTTVDVDRYRFESGQYIRARCAGCQMKSSLVPFPGEVVQLNPLEQVSSWVVCHVLVGRESRVCSPRREAGCSECSTYSCADFVALIRRRELEKDVRVQKKPGGKPPSGEPARPSKGKQKEAVSMWWLRLAATSQHHSFLSGNMQPKRTLLSH
jgi:hypothetical protein